MIRPNNSRSGGTEDSEVRVNPLLLLLLLLLLLTGGRRLDDEAAVLEPVVLPDGEEHHTEKAGPRRVEQGRLGWGRAPGWSSVEEGRVGNIE